MYIIYVINSKPPIQEARYKIKHVQRTATTTSKETENHEVTKPNANTTPTNHRTNKRAQNHTNEMARKYINRRTRAQEIETTQHAHEDDANTMRVR